jgi:hypothetical protein
MNQDINLLTLPTGSRSRHPAAREVGIALLCVIAIGIGGGLWYDHRDSTLARATRDLNAEIDDLVMNLEERSYFLAERDADPVLLAELKRAEREADDKSRVLDLLRGESVGNTDGFSEHLAALGRRHPQGLWLERIRIGDGGRDVLLRGLALDADLIPRFLTGLREEPVLAGTAFATFALAADDARRGPLQFALATGCETGEAGDDAHCVALAPGDTDGVMPGDEGLDP